MTLNFVSADGGEFGPGGRARRQSSKLKNEKSGEQKAEGGVPSGHSALGFPLSALNGGLVLNAHQELGVRAGLAEPRGEQFHRVGAVHLVEDATQQADAAVLCEKSCFTGSRGIVFCSGVGYISIRLGAQAT